MLSSLKQHQTRLTAKFLRGVDLTAASLGLFGKQLRAEALIAAACRREGTTDFGEWTFREPLEVLLRAYEQESDLTAFGRIAVRFDMMRFLCNLLRLREEERKHPEILDEEIKQPIFILGLPRSGTTFLHNLLAQDPANRFPWCWQTIYPYPLRGWRSSKKDRRSRIVAGQFKSFLRLVPELPSLHPLEANAAQECIEITGQVFRSLRFDTTHYVPSYEKWLDEAGHDEAYRFHKRFLQHLQHQSGSGNWVLKSPDHIFALSALAAAYPDARYVFVHRDPLEVLASVTRLTEILRQPFTHQIDRSQIGQQVSRRWAQGAGLLIQASKALKSTPERAFHMHYRTLTRSPETAVQAIYEQFGLSLSREFSERLRGFVTNRPKGGYGQNVYRIEDYGLDPQVERRRYREYIAYFGIGSEAPANLDRGVPPPRKAEANA
ncbi:MAG TPA: sulfotransferase [Candidatus Binataceae bacterium]|nr:sulfotransferase [Candidatus Binataceae bacterium]